ncbi:tellurite resistance TerB family protein [Pseudooceanicola sp. MF1-13]|uniref:tellurite resistance TerB family protein n=1 Tax=Pseudooceanicola sp. MF1-13 TaxID=3379095 RepID=UPI003892CA88
MDVNRLLNEFLGPKTGGSAPSGQAAARASGLPQGLAGGAAAGSLVALLLGTKKGRKLGGKALKYGGLAAVGGLAYKAYRDWQTQQPSGQEADPLSLPRPPADSGFDLENDTDASGQDFRLSVMRAMISAAKSDDHIDADEHARIHARIDDLGLGSAEKAAMFDYFAAPADPAAIAGLARTTEQKAEIYLASALAIDPDTAQEQAYLDALSHALDMPQGLRGHLDLEAAAARRQAETA